MDLTASVGVITLRNYFIVCNSRVNLLSPNQILNRQVTVSKELLKLSLVPRAIFKKITMAPHDFV